MYILTLALFLASGQLSFLQSTPSDSSATAPVVASQNRVVVSSEQIISHYSRLMRSDTSIKIGTRDSTGRCTNSDRAINEKGTITKVSGRLLDNSNCMLRVIREVYGEPLDSSNSSHRSKSNSLLKTLPR